MRKRKKGGDFPCYGTEEKYRELWGLKMEERRVLSLKWNRRLGTEMYPGGLYRMFLPVGFYFNPPKRDPVSQEETVGPLSTPSFCPCVTALAGVLFYSKTFSRLLAFASLLTLP